MPKRSGGAKMKNRQRSLSENQIAGWTHGYYGEKPDPILIEDSGYQKAYDDALRAGRGVRH